MRIQPNHVCLIHSNKYLAIDQGELFLTMPVDTDGALGLQAIKRAGGMVIAQEPKGAV